jgi:hypothetical protein
VILCTKFLERSLTGRSADPTEVEVGGLHHVVSEHRICLQIVGKGKRRSWECSWLQSEQQTCQEGWWIKRRMATEGQRSGQGKDRQQKIKAEMDQELSEIRA